jgi:hypothetical protein
VNEREFAAKGIGKERFTGAVWPRDRPLFIPAKNPGRILENQPIAQAKGGVLEREKQAGRPV